MIHGGLCYRSLRSLLRRAVVPPGLACTGAAARTPAGPRFSASGRKTPDRQRLHPRTDGGALSADRPGAAVPAHPAAHRPDRGDRDDSCHPARLSGRPRDVPARRAGGDAGRGVRPDPALDERPGALLRLDRAVAANRGGQQRADELGPDRPAAQADLHGRRGRHRDDPRADALYDPADLLGLALDPAGARSRGAQSRRRAVAQLHRRHAAAEPARHLCRLHHGLHPVAGLLRHAGAGRRPAEPDDRNTHRPAGHRIAELALRRGARRRFARRDARSRRPVQRFLNFGKAI